MINRLRRILKHVGITCFGFLAHAVAMPEGVWNRVIIRISPRKSRHREAWKDQSLCHQDLKPDGLKASQRNQIVVSIMLCMFNDG